MGQVGDGLVCANSGGLSMLEELQQMNADLKTLIAEGEERSKTRRSFEHRLSLLEAEVRNLNFTQTTMDSLRQKDAELDLIIATLSYPEGYLSTRKRLLAVYKRDHEVIEINNGATPEGDYSAHEGDALADAVLFHRDRRTDKSTYRRLYGLDDFQVLEFQSANNDRSLFLALNAYATIVAQGKRPSDDLKLALGNLIDNVEEYWLQSPKGDPRYPLDLAYNNFWERYNQQRFKVAA